MGVETTGACVACGGGQFRVVFNDLWSNGKQYSVIQCRLCGLGFTEPKPSEDELEPLYQSEYYRTNPPGRHNLLVLMGRYLVRRVLLTHDPLLGSTNPGKILDIGCGNGEFLRRMAKLGWETYGTDSSPAAVRLAQRFAKDVRLATSSEAVFDDQQFDVVTMFNVFEHVPDPVETLAEARRVLKDGGMLVIEVPNFQSLSFSIVRRKWFGLDVPRHLYHFTSKSLGALAQNQGFEVASFRKFKLLSNVYIAYRSLMNKMSPKEQVTLFDSAFEEMNLTMQLRILGKSLIPLTITAPIVLIERLVPSRGESIDIVLRKASSLCA